MAEVVIQGDWLSVFTNGWFEVNDYVPAPTSQSGYYREYDDMPSGYITKCTGPKYNNERELFDLFLTEAYNKYGVCMTYYITTYDANYDRIFGEDNDRRFIRKFNFMSYFTLPREEKLWTKFGIGGMDQFSMYTSKRHFRKASRFNWDQTSANAYPPYIPKIGDILMADYSQYMYEIVEVKEEIGMYLLSKQHVWEFIVKPFRNEHLCIPTSLSAAVPELITAEYGTSGNYINAINGVTSGSSDIYDTKNAVDTRKQQIVYKPKSCERPNQNPFGNW